MISLPRQHTLSHHFRGLDLLIDVLFLLPLDNCKEQGFSVEQPPNSCCSQLDVLEE